jgi:YidC/Oxa1 family membrane protein insertase
MKFNRTEWILMILCVSAFMFTMSQQKPARPAPKPAATSIAPDAAPAATPAPSVPTPTPAAPAATEVLRNTVAEYTFTSAGGALQKVRLLGARYAGTVPHEINAHDSAPAIGALATGPNAVETLTYTVAEKTDRSITWTATAPDGLKISKKWTMDDSGTPEDGPGYLWRLEVSFANTGAAKVASEYALMTGLMGKMYHNDRIFPSLSYYADGNAVEQNADSFDHGGFFGMGARPSDTALQHSLTDLRYAGLHNTYYAVLVGPDAVAEAPTKVFATRQGLHFPVPGHPEVRGWAMSAALGLPPLALEPAATTTWKGTVYTGPRSGTILNKLGGDKNQSMHYGMFRVLSRLFLGTLNTLYDWVKNYGVALMLLTCLVRLSIWPLHLKSTKAMKRMGKLAPMMTELREKYKDDPQRMNVEVMKLYRDYGVNPIGGCWPLLFQFPIFLGYYSMMQSAVEMRGHSFLWVNDLSQPDTIARIAGFPINLLPILMAITMFIQMKIAPQPMEMNPQMKLNQTIFKIMPIMFLWFCYDFASALALYWTVQNIISIYQTWLIKRQPEPALEKVARKPSFMERAMEMQKMRNDQLGRSTKPSGPKTGGGGGSAFRDQKKK